MRALFLLVPSILLVLGCHAAADLDRWSVNVEEDPFDQRGKMTLGNMDSFVTGMLVMCEQQSDEITVRYASPFTYDQSAPPDAFHTFSLAFDTGERHDAVATVGLLGTGRMGFDATFRGDEARAVLAALAAARSKLYVKVGAQDPRSFSAWGSTNAANRALAFCFVGP